MGSSQVWGIYTLKCWANNLFSFRPLLCQLLERTRCNHHQNEDCTNTIRVCVMTRRNLKRARLYQGQLEIEASSEQYTLGAVSPISTGLAHVRHHFFRLQWRVINAEELVYTRGTEYGFPTNGERSTLYLDAHAKTCCVLLDTFDIEQLCTRNISPTQFDQPRARTHRCLKE